MTDIRCEHCGHALNRDPLEGLERLQWRLDNGKPWNWLSPRMKEVIALVGGGMTYAATATALGISVRTVHTHVERIAQRLDIQGRPRDGIRDYYKEHVSVQL